jgi:hypothetical protein
MKDVHVVDNTNSSTVVDITYGWDVTNTWQFPLLIIFF